VQPDGGPTRKLEGIPATCLQPAALDTRLGLAAAADGYAPESGAIHVVDLGSGTTRSFPLRDREDRAPYSGGVVSLGFAADGSLFAGGEGGVDRWDLATGERTTVCGGVGNYGEVSMNRTGRSAIAQCPDYSVLVVDPLSGAQRRITSHGDAVRSVAMDATGERIATGDSTGAVRVGWATGEEPHLLIGHSDFVIAVAFSPDGKWLASASGAEVILWPMPDLSKPPLHTLPHDELLAKLHSLTNLRAVREPASDTGWKIELGPFPGWRDVPTW